MSLPLSDLPHDLPVSTTSPVDSPALVPVRERRFLSKKFLPHLLRIAGLLLVVALGVLAYSFRDRAEQLALLGYPGIFLIAMFSSATVVLPMPGLAVVFAMGGILNPFIVALVAGTGAAIGEITAYIAGVSGQAVIERMDIYERITPYITRFGPWTMFILAAIPNPFFDLAGVAAGVLKMPFWRFFLAIWAGQIIKMSLFAYAGAFSLGWF